MKKTLSIILSLILVLGVIVGIGVSAYAEESEVFTLPDVTLNEETYLTLEDMGISDFVSQIREHFPPTIEPKYENGVLSIPNVQAATATYYSFTDYNDYEMKTIVKTYLECNMNISKASNVLYMHRNTLMYKIDNFINETGFDIKKFKDAYIIYHIL